MYDFEDLDLGEELVKTSSPDEAKERINQVLRALKSGLATDGIQRAVTDLQEAVKLLQSSKSQEAPSFTTAERALSSSYLRPSGEGKTAALLTRGTIRIGRASVEVPGLLDDARPDVPEIQRELQIAAESRTLIRRAQLARGSQPSTPILDAEIMRLAKLLPGELARAFVDVAGSGGEFIPDVTLPEVIRRAEWARRLAGLFEVVPLTGGTNVIPRLDAGAIPYLIAETTDDDPAKIPTSTPVTASNSYTPITMAARVKIGGNASEDSLIPMMPLIRQALVEALVGGVEDAIYNGDATATHQDDITNWNPAGVWGDRFLASAGASNDHRRAWTGLRARAFDVANTVNRSTLTFATLLADQAALVGQPGPTGTALICSPQAIGVIGALSQFSTIDVVGPQASNVQGLAVGSILGCPVILSEFATDDLNASGLYDNTTKTKGSAAFVRTGRFKLYSRRQAMIETAKDISTQMTELVITSRDLFGAASSTTEKNVRYLYNIA